MKWKVLVLFLVVEVCQGAPAGGSDEVTFFAEKQFGGDRLFVTLGSGCYNMERDWDNRAVSVDTQGNCIMIWDFKDCKGDSLKLTPDAAEAKDLSRVRFHKAISAISVCPAVRPKSQQSDRGGPDFWKVALDEHNKYRRMHGVPDLFGDVQLHDEAQGHADFLARNNRFEASSGNNFGENLATSYNKDKLEAIRDVVKRWYDKIDFYNFRDPESNKDRPKSGQFTSIIWKATSHMGVGVAWNDVDKKWVIVVNYDPPAKRTGYKENIPPPSRSAHENSPALLRTAMSNLYNSRRRYPLRNF